MTITLRQIAVSGSAAVALLGGAAAITVADSPTASAETQTVAHHSVTAPVTLPDGRTMRITGMGGYGHQASAEHIAAVASFKTDATPGTAGITNGLTPDNTGSGSSLQNPYSQQQLPAGYNQQITTQSAGGYVAAGAVGILLFGAIAIIRLRHNAHKGDAILFLFLGVGLGGTAIGTMIHQLTANGVGSLGGMLGGL